MSLRIWWFPSEHRFYRAADDELSTARTISAQPDAISVTNPESLPSEILARLTPGQYSAPWPREAPTEVTFTRVWKNDAARF